MKNIQQAVSALSLGEVIAYPTEGVFGLGCDPDNEQAILKLLDIKNRSAEKGLILIAASFEQLYDYIDIEQLSASQLKEVQQTWPGAVTWVMPVRKSVNRLVCGKHDSVAVRVTAHSLVRDLCLKFGKPVTSTSANLSGFPACKTRNEVIRQFTNHQLTIVCGETLGLDKPTQIRDVMTGRILRDG